MDVQSAFDRAEVAASWKTAKEAMFKAFDAGLEQGVPMAVIYTVSCDTCANMTGNRLDSTIRAWFDEWASTK